MPKSKFSGVKLISSTNFNVCTLSNSSTKLKIFELIASINWQIVGQIAAYAGNVSLILFTPIFHFYTSWKSSWGTEMGHCREKVNSKHTSIERIVAFCRIDISCILWILRINCLKKLVTMLLPWNSNEDIASHSIQKQPPEVFYKKWCS